MNSPAMLHIDFVSDISCPWCAIGLAALGQALESLAGEISAEIHCQPFELNPVLGPEGENAVEHLVAKYGSSRADIDRIQDTIHARGAALGFTFDFARRVRIWNTFDAHRLLHWAGTLGAEHQMLLKKALFRAYFTLGENVADHTVLVRLADEAGLDPARAAEVLASREYAEEVRRAEAHYQAHGIHSVPAVIINRRHLVSGGQPPEIFAEALRRVALETPEAEPASR